MRLLLCRVRHEAEEAGVSVPPKSIQVGQCYLTGSGHIRRVIGLLSNGQVRYDLRASTKTPERWIAAVLDLESFASSVDRTVPCDWTPERDGAG